MIVNDDYEEMIVERMDTASTAPTVLLGFEDQDRMLDVRPSAHIAGKRRAPKPPPPPPASPPSKGESNYEKLGNFAKVNKVQKIEQDNTSSNTVGFFAYRY